MSGTTTDNGKFIMPLKEKLSYDDSSGRCDSEGFAICLDKIKIFIQGKTLNLELTKNCSLKNSIGDVNLSQDSDFEFIFLKTRMNKKS